MDHKVPNEEILESIADQFTAALRAGQTPSIRDFQAEYPDLADEISSVLSSIAMIENLKKAAHPPNRQDQLLHLVGGLTQIDSYQILEEIGRGGMGVVFAAQHQSLGRKVAIKVLPTPPVDGAKYIERFQREAQAAAKLHHTNIVSVFGVGQGDSYYYYVMDLVEGETLSELLAQWRGKADADLKDLPPNNPSDQKASSLQKANGQLAATPWQFNASKPNNSDRSYYRWLAELGAHLSDALNYAHSKGILHRDIKPSNLILDRNGTLWITDFGLAKDIACSSELTQIGEVVGTPQYLPPESLDGKYDQRSEVYGVGLILFELATLRPAYPGGSPAELIRAIATRSPEPVRKVNPNLPMDLATIIDKSLSRSPGDRYQSAEELKQDLEAFADQRSISARRPSLLETSRRWARRNPLAAGLAAVSAALLGLVAITASLGFMAARSALKKEAEITYSLRQQQAATESARLQAEETLVMLEAQHQRAESNLALSMEAFDEMFRAILSRGVQSSIDVDIDGYREISGIETALTTQDAEFLDRMVAFYEEFASLNADNDNLKAESARAYRRVGNIYQLVGQLPRGIEAYEKSLKLLPEASEDSVADESVLLTRVRTQNELSNALRRNGALLPAQQLYRNSIRILENSPLSDDHPSIRLELARSLAALGFNMLRATTSGSPNRPPGTPPLGTPPLGMPPPGMPPLGTNRSDMPRTPSGRSAQNRFNQNGPMNRDRPEPHPPELADGPEGDRGRTQTENRPESAGRSEDADRSAGRRGRPDENRGPRGVPSGRRDALDRASRFWDRQNKPLNLQALEILDDLIELEPENAEYQSVRATCYFNLAAATIDDDREQGIEYRSLAINALDILVQKNPENAEYQYLLGLACSLVSDSVDADESRFLSRGAEVTHQLIIRHPAMLDYHHLHANLRVKQASYYTAQRERERAVQELNLVRPSVEYLLKRSTSDRSITITIGMLVRELQHLARSYREDGNPRQANELNQYLMRIRHARANEE